MTIDNELIDNLLKDYQQPEDLIGENGLLKQLTKQLLERASSTAQAFLPPVRKARLYGYSENRPSKPDRREAATTT